jgi:integrase-like protein
LWQDHGLVFPSQAGTPMNADNFVKRSFKPLLKRTGLPQIAFHDLRHTFASLMLLNRAPQSRTGNDRAYSNKHYPGHLLLCTPGYAGRGGQVLRITLLLMGYCQTSVKKGRGMSPGPFTFLSFTCKTGGYLGALGRTRTCEVLIRSHFRSRTRADTEGHRETKLRFYRRYGSLGETRRDKKRHPIAVNTRIIKYTLGPKIVKPLMCFRNKTRGNGIAPLHAQALAKCARVF